MDKRPNQEIIEEAEQAATEVAAAINGKTGSGKGEMPLGGTSKEEVGKTILAAQARVIERVVAARHSAEVTAG